MDTTVGPTGFTWIWPPGAPVVSTSTARDPGIWGGVEAEAVRVTEGVGEPDGVLGGVGVPDGVLVLVPLPDGVLVLVPLPEVVEVTEGVAVPVAEAPEEGVPEFEGVAESEDEAEHEPPAAPVPKIAMLVLVPPPVKVLVVQGPPMPPVLVQD